MAKRIRISDDNGVNIYTFPGSTGDFRRELASVTDTVFGQDYRLWTGLPVPRRFDR